MFESEKDATSTPVKTTKAPPHRTAIERALPIRRSGSSSAKWIRPTTPTATAKPRGMNHSRPRSRTCQTSTAPTPREAGSASGAAMRARTPAPACRQTASEA